MNGATVLLTAAHPGDSFVFLAEPPPLGVLLHFGAPSNWENSMTLSVCGPSPFAVMLGPWCGVGTGAVEGFLPPGTPVSW